MSSVQDRQANTSEARLDQLDHDMRQLMATVQELAVSVRESRTRRMNSTGQVDEVRSNLSADEDGNLDSGVASIDNNQQGTAQDEFISADLRRVTRRSDQASNFLRPSAPSELKLKLRSFNGDASAWLSWSREALCYAGLHGFSSALTSEEHIEMVPQLNRNVHTRNGLLTPEASRARSAWLLLLTTISDETLKALVYESKSPSRAWQQLCDWFTPKTNGTLIDSFNDFLAAKLSRGGNPLELHAKLSSIATLLSANVIDQAVIRWIRNDLLSMRFITALSSDYDNEVRSLRVDVSRGRIDSARIKQVIGDRFHTLQRSDRSTKGHALVASERQRSSARGGERSNGKAKRSNKKPGAPKKEPPSSAQASQPSNSPPSKCGICGQSAHEGSKCPRRVCSTCGGRGHSADICPSSAKQATAADEDSAPDASVLAVDDFDHGLIAHPGKTASNAESESTVERWICDSGSTVHCSPDMRGFIDYTPQKSS